MTRRIRLHRSTGRRKTPRVMTPSGGHVDGTRIPGVKRRPRTRGCPMARAWTRTWPTRVLSKMSAADGGADELDTGVVDTSVGDGGGVDTGVLESRRRRHGRPRCECGRHGDCRRPVADTSVHDSGVADTGAGDASVVRPTGGETGSTVDACLATEPREMVRWPPPPLDMCGVMDSFFNQVGQQRFSGTGWVILDRQRAPDRGRLRARWLYQRRRRRLRGLLDLQRSRK